MREKVPIALDGIRTCTSGIRAHRAADYTTKVGPASRQSKRTLQTLTRQLHRETIMLENTPTPICGTATSSICKDLR